MVPHANKRLQDSPLPEKNAAAIGVAIARFLSGHQFANQPLLLGLVGEATKIMMHEDNAK